MLATPVECGEERAEVVERYLVGDADPLHQALAPEYLLPEPLVLSRADPLDVGDPQRRIPLGVEVVELVEEDQITPEPQDEPVVGRIARIAPRDVRHLSE